MVNEKFFTIDAHCHIYPEKIASKAVGSTDNFYGVTSYGKGQIEDLLEVGAEGGIDYFIVHSVATTPAQVIKINEFIAKEVKNNPKKLTGLGALHPDSEDIKGDIEHLIELGLHGVKMHPDIQKFELDCKNCLKLYDICAQKGLPVLLHTGDDRYDFSNPNRLMPVLKDFPSLTIVGAHFGGYSIWEKASSLMHNIPNLYVDCSSTFGFIKKDLAKRLIQTYGEDKIMFATDYPMWRAKTEIDYLLSLGFNDDVYKKIFSENAKKVYKINNI